MSEIESSVEEIAKFLSFFAKARIYRPIDGLARPFSYEDVVSALEDAIRQARVLKESAIEKQIEGKKRRVVEVRTNVFIEEPFIPSREVLNEFLKLCKEDLIHAREAALLALSY